MSTARDAKKWNKPETRKKKKKKEKRGGEPRLECDGVACAAKPPEAEEKPLGTIDPATRSMIVWEMLPLTDLCIPFERRQVLWNKG